MPCATQLALRFFYFTRITQARKQESVYVGASQPARNTKEFISLSSSSRTFYSVGIYLYRLSRCAVELGILHHGKISVVHKRDWLLSGCGRNCICRCHGRIDSSDHS